MTTILDSIKETLSENLDIDEDRVTPESTFDELGIDSLDMVEMVCELEEKCDVEMGEPEGLETVADLVSYIEAKQEA